MHNKIITKSGLKKHLAAFILASVTAITSVVATGIGTVQAATTDPEADHYFEIATAEEMNSIRSQAENIDYTVNYKISGENDNKHYYKVTVTSKGYLTFSLDNPFKSIKDNYNLKTTIGVLDDAGHYLWVHHYDYGDEAANDHGYNIGLNPGTYYAYISSGLFTISETTMMTYHFSYTETDAFEAEPNNSREMANDYILGTTVSGEYGARAWMWWPKGIADDYFKVTLEKGKSYTFNMKMHDMYKEKETYEYFIENSSGEIIIKRFEFYTQEANTTDTFTCPKTDTYYIHINNGDITSIDNVMPYTFSINEKKSEVPTTTIKKITPQKKSAKITWGKIKGVSGYQIQYSTSKEKIDNGKKVTIKGQSKTGTTIKKLSSKKSYYFRIRTYKIVDKKKLYSEWSAAKKSKKIKK